MTPGARLQAAIEIIDEINTTNAPADNLISAYFKKRRYAGSKDRRAIAERIYGTLRKHARLAWWIKRTGSTATITARLRIIADLALSDKLHTSDIADLFSGSRHCPPTLDDNEAALANAVAGRPLTHQTDMPDYVRHEYPQWLERSLKETFGDALGAEMSALNQPAPMDLRVNTAKTSVQQVLGKLAQEHIEASPCPWSPLALRVSGNVKMGGVAAYKNGLVEIQDEGSQLLALMCDARPGMTVVDFCAGAGGKTLALAASMTEQGALHGTLTACDIFSSRLSRIKPRLERAGAGDIVQKVLVSEDDPWVGENKYTADRVLLDVPCSATGIWRRTPLAKWQLEPTDLEDLILTQRRILASASTLVKPGGRLIYATCSILTEENENQINWFLDQTAEFQVLEGKDIWQQSIGSLHPPTSGPYIRLTPASTQTDGFFCAVLERRL